MTVAAESEAVMFDVAVIGAGPAGLSAALQLARSRLRVLVVDSNRPRHAATLLSHGFLTRDGVSPLELRQLGREELEAYETVEFVQGTVTELTGLTHAVFGLTVERLRSREVLKFAARRVLLTVGLREELPELPLMRAFYGTALHSCIQCDAFEKSDQRLVLIGETSDVFERALILRRFSDDLIVFTNDADTVTPDEETALTRLGVRVERRALADLVGERGMMTGVKLADGEVIERDGGFVRPRWHAPLEFLGDLKPDQDDWGLVHVDDNWQTSTPGLYAAGDIVPPGPEQLIIAAGHGAQAAAKIVRDLTLSV